MQKIKQIISTKFTKIAAFRTKIWYFLMTPRITFVMSKNWAWNVFIPLLDFLGKSWTQRYERFLPKIYEFFVGLFYFVQYFFLIYCVFHFSYWTLKNANNFSMIFLIFLWNILLFNANFSYFIKFRSVLIENGNSQNREEKSKGAFYQSHRKQTTKNDATR